MHVVGPKWFSESVAKWKRQNEKPYLLVDPAKKPAARPSTQSQPRSQGALPGTPQPAPNESALPSRSTTPQSSSTGEVPQKETRELQDVWAETNREVEEAMGDDEDDEDDDGDNMDSTIDGESDGL